MTYQSTILADAPKLYLPLNGDTSNLGASPITVSSTLPFVAGGIDGQCIKGNGTSTYLRTTGGMPQVESDGLWSVEAWVKIPADAVSNNQLVFAGSLSSDYFMLLGYGPNHATTSIRGRVSASIYIGGNAYNTGNSAIRLDDGNWHHVVVTASATTFALYIDGSLSTSAALPSAQAGNFNANWSVSSRYNSGSFSVYSSCYMDEVAVYDSALSATKVQNHYDAAFAPAIADAAFAATPATAAAAMGNGAFTNATPIVVSAGAMTASAIMPDGTVSGTTPIIAFATSTTISPTYSYGPSDSVHAVFDTSGLDAGTVTGASLRVRVSGSAYASRIDIYYNGTLVGSTPTIASNSTNKSFNAALDNAALKAAIRNGTVDYLDLKIVDLNSSDPTTYLYYSTTGGAPFYLDVALMPNAGTVATAPAATGSAVAVDPAVVPGYGPTAAAEAATATAVAADAVATVQNGVLAVAQPAEAAADMPGGYWPDAMLAAPALEVFGYAPDGGFAVPVLARADVAISSGLLVDPAARALTNTIIEAGAASASAYIAPPLEVDESADDRYYQYIVKTLNDDLSGGQYAYGWWARLDQHAGSSAPIMDNNGNLVTTETAFGKPGTLSGTYNWNTFGPESRRALHMDSGSMVMAAPSRPSDTSAYWKPDSWSFEAVIRTTDSQGTIFHGNQTWGQTGGFNDDIRFGLVDGKLNWTANTSLLITGGRRNSPASFSSIKRIDDNEWHHVVVQSAVGFSDDPATPEREAALEFWIDGKLDRRVIYGEDGRALNFNTYASPQDWFAGFTGDIMEVVWRNDELEKTNIERLYYTAFGFNPFFADVATASAQMLEAKVKGNRGRMLVLHFQNADVNGLYDIPTSPTRLDTNVGALPAFTKDQDGHLVYSNVAGMIVSHQNVVYPAHPSDMVQGYTPAYQKQGLFLDDVSGKQRFIDLQVDLDLSEFDVIAVKNYPHGDGQKRAAAWLQGSNANTSDFEVRQRYEDFLASVRQAVTDGSSLVVTDPYLAVDLGLVDRVEEISRLRDPALDSGIFNTFEEHAFGQQDPRAYMIDPFGGWAQSDRMPTSAEQALDSYKLHGRDVQLYYDTHDNNRSRIVATVEGLTDLPAWVVSDYINDVYPDPLKYSAVLRTGNTFRYANKEDGLNIGDEFVEETHIFSKPGNSVVNTDVVIPAAIPPGHLLVGKVLVRYGAKQWNQLTLVDNPYADYIKAAVVQPGDRWKGQTIKGRVFIAFGQNNEVESTVMTLWEDDLEHPVVKVPVGADSVITETDYTKTWQKSAARTSVGSTQYISGNGTDQSGPGGTNGPSGHWVQQVSADGSTSMSWVQDSNNKLPILPDYVPTYEQIPHVNMPMLVRGLAWLRTRNAVSAGDVVISTAPFEAGGELAESHTTADHSVTIAVEPMQAKGDLRPAAEVKDKAAVVQAWAATATGVMNPLEKRVYADPAVVTAAMGQGTQFVFDARNAIPLYIQGPETITLYLEDY